MPTPKQIRLEEASNIRDRSLKCGEDTFIAWKAGVIMSNNTGSYRVDDVGVSKQVILTIPKSDFLDYDLASLSEVFDLTVSHIKILTVMLTQERYFRQFRWNAETKASLAAETGLTESTLTQTMPSLHKNKGLVIKIRNGLYKINREILSHRLDIKDLQCVDRVISIRFSDEQKAPLSVLHGGVLLDKDFVDRINWLWNKQVKGESVFKHDLGEHGANAEPKEYPHGSHVKKFKARPAPPIVEEGKNPFE